MNIVIKSFTAMGVIFTGFGLIFWLGILLTGNNSIDGMAGIQTFFKDNGLIFTIFRIALLGIIFYLWRDLCNWFGRFKKLDQKMVDYLFDSRNSIMIWFVFIELLVNQNTIGWLLLKL